jgi:hypothetical protein
MSMRFTAAALLLTVSLVLGPAARASVAWLETVEGLASRCDAVVRARVETCEARLSADGRRIYTHAVVRCSDVWRGSAPSRLVVRIPGGTVGDLSQRVEGAPALRPGEDIVLFLRRSGPAFSIAGLGQGKFAIEGGEAVPDVHGFARIPSALPDGHRAVEKMPIAELERRVRSAR